MDTRQKDLTSKTLVLYYVIFYLTWVARTFTLLPLMESLGMGDVRRELINAAIKIVLWTLPALLLIKKYDGSMYVPLKDMFLKWSGWLGFLPAAALLAVYNLAASYVVNGRIGFANFKYSDLIGAVVFIGITEEVVFRGWLLNAMVEKMSRNRALALNTALFLVVHFPAWIAKGTFINNIFSGSFLSIIAVSLIFGWAFLKSRNILVPIFLHMLWNLLVTVFVG